MVVGRRALANRSDMPGQERSPSVVPPVSAWWGPASSSVECAKVHASPLSQPLGVSRNLHMTVGRRAFAKRSGLPAPHACWAGGAFWKEDGPRPPLEFTASSSGMCAKVHKSPFSQPFGVPTYLHMIVGLKPPKFLGCVICIPCRSGPRRSDQGCGPSLSSTRSPPRGEACGIPPPPPPKSANSSNTWANVHESPLSQPRGELTYLQKIVGRMEP
mmetsp:Transcript_23730/g.65999  ORF Transcript_23730/g.65999 Transcript_23730/m.65999 type:complete len:215 (+) Transcript_23730:330-974(+)